MLVVKIMTNKHPSITIYVVHCLWLHISPYNTQIRISYVFQYLTLKKQQQRFQAVIMI
jgi:hypothetical protein